MIVSRRWIPLVLCCLWACGRNEPAGPPQSTPVQLPDAPPRKPAAPVPVTPDAGAVPDPVHPPELEPLYPGLSVLPEARKVVAVGALNLVPGPCGACAKADEHLARCALRVRTPGCANVPVLVRRAIRLAGAGDDLRTVMEAIHFPDIWVPIPGATDRVDVDLVLDPESPWAAEARATAATLQETYGEKISVRTHRPDSAVASALSTRSTPSWAVAGYRMRGAQSTEALGRLIRREVAQAGVK